MKILDYDIFQEVEKDILKYSREGNIILAGDLNAKTNIKSDFVSDINDQHSPINEIETYPYDVPLPRENQDKHPVDSQGQRVLDLCKFTQTRILNGRIKGDRTGSFTRYPLSLRETPSTLDYVITDIRIMKKIKTFSVLHHLGLSDHECLLVSIETKNLYLTPPTKTLIIKDEKCLQTNSDVAHRKLNSPEGIKKMLTFLAQHSKANETTIDEMSSDLIETLHFISTPIYGKKNHKKKKKERKNKNKPS